MITNRQKKINDLVLLILLLSLGCALIYAMFSENLFLVGIVSGICSVLISFIINIINSLIPRTYSIKKILRILSLTLKSKKIRAIITVILLFILLEAILSLQNDPEIMMYVIDNSGSMGCYSGELNENKPKLDKDGYCQEKSVKLKTAKNWIKNDISNKKKYRKIGLIEIGGFTSANRQNENNNCNVKSRITLGISNYNKLTKELDNIKANASGATDIVRAIIDSSKELENEPDTYTKNIAVISDLEHNCKSNINDITKQLEKELDYKPEIIQDFVEKNVTVYTLKKDKLVNNSLINILFFSRALANNLYDNDVAALRRQGIKVVEIPNYDNVNHLPDKEYYLRRRISGIVFLSIIFIYYNLNLSINKNKHREIVDDEEKILRINGLDVRIPTIHKNSCRFGNSTEYISSFTPYISNDGVNKRKFMITLSWNSRIIMDIDLIVRVYDNHETQEFIEYISYELTNNNSINFIRDSESGGPIILQLTISDSKIYKLIATCKHNSSDPYQDISSSECILSLHSKDKYFQYFCEKKAEIRGNTCEIASINLFDKTISIEDRVFNEDNVR